MHSSTNTTTQTNTTSPTETSIESIIAELIVELKHVRARREDFTEEQLIELSEKAIPTLETFYEQTDDEHTIGHLETAQGGIEHALDSLKNTGTAAARPLVPMLLLAIDAIEAVQEENSTDD